MMKIHLCICVCIMLGSAHAVLPEWWRFHVNSDAREHRINTDSAEERKSVLPYEHFAMKPEEDAVRSMDIRIPNDEGIFPRYDASDLLEERLIAPEEGAFIPAEDERYYNEHLYNAHEIFQGVRGFIYPEQNGPVHKTEYAYRDNAVADEEDDQWNGNEYFLLPRFIVKEPGFEFIHPEIKLRLHKIISSRPLRRFEYPKKEFDNSWDEVDVQEKRPQPSSEFGLEDKTIDNPSKSRSKRANHLVYDLGTALILRGLRATRQLLAGTKEVTTEGKVWKYEKKGSAHEAFKDFMSVEPSEIRNFNTGIGAIGKMGRVGDRQIKIFSRKADGNPTIEITKITEPFDPEKRIVITYGRHFL